LKKEKEQSNENPKFGYLIGDAWITQKIIGSTADCALSPARVPLNCIIVRVLSHQTTNQVNLH